MHLCEDKLAVQLQAQGYRDCNEHGVVACLGHLQHVSTHKHECIGLLIISWRKFMPSVYSSAMTVCMLSECWHWDFVASYVRDDKHSNPFKHIGDVTPYHLAAYYNLSQSNGAQPETTHKC